MPKVTVYMCPFTHQLFHFSEKESYIKHLKTVRTRHRKARELARITRNWLEFLETGQQSVCSLRELGEWIIENVNIIGKYAHAMHSVHLPPETFRITEIRFKNPQYSSMCSNSHSSPVWKRSNWGGREEGVPRGYPGITFQLEFTVAGTSGKYMGDLFSSILMHLGTGGSRGVNAYSFHTTIWLEDWPRLEESISLAILRNNLNKVDEIIVKENS